MSGADVAMYLKGENRITQNAGHSATTDNGSEFAACAIEKSSTDGSLSIQLADGLTDNADGVLVAEGKSWHEGAITSAQVGVSRLVTWWKEQGIDQLLPLPGDDLRSFANLTISSGTITTISGAHTPGIGAACGGESCKNIQIDGAWVKAVGGEFCAGIGTGDGYRGAAVHTSTLVDGLTISGGAQVYAKGGACSSGIGTGGEDIGTVDDGEIGLKNFTIKGGETVVVAVGDDGHSRMYGNRYYTTEASGTWGMESGVKTPGIGVGYCWQSGKYAGQIDSSTVVTIGSSSEVDTEWYSGKEAFPDVVSEMNETSFKTNGVGQTDDGKAKAWEARLQYGDSAADARFFSRPDTGSLDVSGYTGLGSLSQAALEAGSPVYYMRFYYMPDDTTPVASDKTLVSQVENEDGTSTLTYEISLVNNGEELSTSGWSFSDVASTDGTVSLSYTGPSKVTQATDPPASWTDARSGAAYAAASDASKFYVEKTQSGFSVSALPVGVKLVFTAAYKTSGPAVATSGNTLTGPTTPDGRQHYSVEVEKTRVSAPDATGAAVSGDARVRPGEPIYYKVTAKNTSEDADGAAIALPAGAKAGTVVDEAVRGLTLVAAAPAAGSASLDTGANSITWTLGPVAAGATCTMYVTGTVTDEGVSAEASEAADTVNKASSQGDPPSVSVVSTPHAPALSANKVLVSFDSATGAALWRIYVANESDKDYVAAPVKGDLEGASVQSVAAVGAALASKPAAGDTGTVSAVLDLVPAGTRKVAASDERNPAGWTSAVYVEVSGTAAAGRGASNAVEPGRASHALSKARVGADGSDAARPASETLAAGQTVWYRVSVENISGAALGSLTVVDAPVSHLRLDSVGTVSQGSASLSATTGRVTWETGALAAGASASMWVCGTVLALQASEGGSCEVTNAAFDGEDSVTVTDVEVGVPFSFTKTDAAGAALAGASFTLFSCSNAAHTQASDHSERVTNGAGCCWKAGDAVQEAESGADGKVSFTGLGQGQYMLVETAAPEGYELPHGQWMVDVDVASSTFSITARGEDGNLPPAFKKDAATGAYSVANYRKWTMPLAGGTGTIAFTAAGSALVAAACAWILLAGRKRAGDAKAS